MINKIFLSHWVRHSQIELKYKNYNIFITTNSNIRLTIIIIIGVKHFTSQTVGRQQKLTDANIENIDKLLKDKEKEISQI